MIRPIRQNEQRPSRLDKHITEGMVNGKPARDLYNTGADLILVKNELVDPSQFTGKSATVRSAFGDGVR